METNIIIAVIFAWVSPFFLGIILGFLLYVNWTEYRYLCYGMIIGYIWGLLLYLSIVPNMFMGVI